MKLNWRRLNLLILPTIFTPLIAAACNDSRDPKLVYQIYKDTIARAKALDYDKKEYDSNLYNQHLLIDTFFNNDLVLYLEAKNKLESNNADLLNLESKIQNHLIIINKILNNQDSLNFENIKEQYTNLKAKVESKLSEINQTIPQMFIMLKEIKNNIVYYAKNAIEIQSSSILSLINKQLNTLHNFLNDAEINKEIKSIYQAENKIEKISAKYTEIIAKINNFIEKAQYYTDFNFVDDLKQFIEDSSKYNNENNYYHKDYQNVELNLAIAFYKLYLIEHKEQNTEKILKNTDFSTQVNNILNQTYNVKMQYYFKVVEEFKKLVNFIEYIGPQDDTKLKSLGLIPITEEWSKNLNLSITMFNKWRQKIKNKELILYTDNFKSDLPYWMRLDNDQIIWINSYQNMSKNYSKKEY